MNTSTIPVLTVKQMQEVDRVAVEEFGISTLMLMENASRNIAIMARKMLGGSVANKKIIVLSHKGNNGGDGLGATRHLINFGAIIHCYLTTPPESLSPDSQVQYKILKNIGANITVFNLNIKPQLEKDLKQADLIIDALLGYNLKGAPRAPVDSVIKLANNSGKKILAVDVPSGLNADTGKAYNPTIKTHTTLTLALPKTGLLTEKAKPYVGDLYLADISIPQKVYRKLGISVP